MKSITLFTLFYIAISLLALKAQTIRHCATHEVYENNVRKYPGYETAVNHAFDYAKNYSRRAAANKASDTWDTVYRIPVVIHVVHNTPDQNINDSLIYNQIEVLNQDYRRQNTDTGNTRSIFASIAADAGIEFFLATTDPDGNPSTGIVRTYTDTPFFSVIGDIFSGGTENGADRVKKTASGGSDAWDTDNYLNIWVCNMSDPNSFFGMVLGFAYPPDSAPNWPVEAFPADSSLHGVVIHYEVFGRNNPRAIGQLDLATRGRTTVHEVGHYLGLRHIWGDGPLSIFIPDCSVDDGIDDTPNSGNNSQQEASTAINCNIVKNTCSDTINDLPDMWENYMDYSREECQNVFTFGQVGVMRATLVSSRSELPVFEEDSVPTAISQFNQQSFDFSVIPNPTFGNAEIIFSENSMVGEITINDLVGKTWIHFATNGRKKIPFSMEHLPKGIYTIIATSAEKFAAKKIVLN